MKVFVDECVDWRFSRDVAAHELLVPDLLATIPVAKRGAVTYVGA